MTSGTADKPKTQSQGAKAPWYSVQIYYTTAKEVMSMKNERFLPVKVTLKSVFAVLYAMAMVRIAFM